MSGLDPELSINAALDAIAEKPSTPADAPPVLDKDTAERLLKLSRLANSPNENEAAVAQEMLDKVAKKFGMTGEEAEIADQHYSEPRLEAGDPRPIARAFKVYLKGYRKGSTGDACGDHAVTP